jgi:hypothetical protein
MAENTFHKPHHLADVPKFKTSANSACPLRFKRLRFAQDMTEKDPPSELIGYARVSTYGQSLSAQLEDRASVVI